MNEKSQFSKIANLEKELIKFKKKLEEESYSRK